MSTGKKLGKHKKVGAMKPSGTYFPATKQTKSASKKGPKLKPRQNKLHMPSKKVENN